MKWNAAFLNDIIIGYLSIIMNYDSYKFKQI